MISVIIPSHNEEKIIIDTLESILNQSYKPDNIIVCLDNCTDWTKEIVQTYSQTSNVKFYETVDNINKKAGAINQVFDKYTFQKYILVMDADTILDKDLIKEGIKFLENNPDHGAVCSRAGILKPKFKNIKERILWQLQHIEYSMFDSERIETHGKIKVSHGMCTIYRVKALNEAIFQRGVVYLNNCLTEDYELTLTLKKNNWKISTNLKMKAWTDVPLNIKDLWRQRYRWLLGGIDSLKLHGINSYTFADIMNHLLFIVLFIIQIYLVIVSIIFYKNITFLNSFIGILILLSVMDSLYRSKYIQDRTLVDYLCILTVAPLVLYNIFNCMTLLYSYWLSLTNKKIKW